MMKGATKESNRRNNQLFRLFILDRLLADRNHYYTRKDLLEQCNREMMRLGKIDTPFDRKTIENDLIYMGCSQEPSPDFPFRIEFETGKIPGEKGKRYIRYKEDGFSIFRAGQSLSDRLTEAERNSIFAILDRMQALDGGILSKHANSLFGRSTNSRGLPSATPVSYSADEIALWTNESFVQILDYIEHKKPVSFSYRPFYEEDDGDLPSRLIVSPYQFRDFNGHRFLVGRDHKKYETSRSNAGTRGIRTFDIDLINPNSISPVPDESFIAYKGDIDKYFTPVIGVSVYEQEGTIQAVDFSVSPERARRIRRHRIHPSQIELESHDYTDIPEGWSVFRLKKCLLTQELYSTFLSYGEEFLALDPRTRRTMARKVRGLSKLYEHK